MYLTKIVLYRCNWLGGERKIVREWPSTGSYIEAKQISFWYFENNDTILIRRGIEDYKYKVQFP